MSLAAAARALITTLALLAAWWLLVKLTAAPAYLLPDPISVAAALWHQRAVLFWATLITLTETLLGLLLGTLLGATSALAIVFSPLMQRWLLPLLLMSQAIPVFALAPLLVLWFGYGIASKIVMTILVIFFPITAAFSDGLRRTDPGLLELARTMNAPPFAVLRHVRLPAALPAFGSGLRVATAIAPIGAIVGEWVGASAGLGYVMLNANARIQTDLMLAAVVILAVMTMTLWVIVDKLLRHALTWAPET